MCVCVCVGGVIYLSLHCHLQNDSCIKMGNDESHFNVSLTVRDKVTRQCPQTTTLEVKPGRAEAMGLCHTEYTAPWTRQLNRVSENMTMRHWLVY